MTAPDELIVIFDRILNGSRDETDINLLRQYLGTAKGQNQVQLAKNIINAAELRELHIGDRTYYGADAETIKAVIREILPEIIHNIGIEKSSQENPQISQTKSEKSVDTNNSPTQLLSPAPIPNLTTFEFEVVSVNVQGGEIKRCRKQAEYFTENLGDGVVLEMVSIPGSKFQMGAPLDEFASHEDERPQHVVDIQPFFMSKYPITQVQWRVIATLQQINHHLNLEPSYFQGDNLPVEGVSWYHAHEFCERLSQKTRRNYRLPSEAEWEYACRARTTTPFYFGETITTHLANYCGQNRKIQRRSYKGTYGDELLGVYRQQTTEIGCFPANAFGLYDMHGLVKEWCADHRHENYQGAPSDSSAWINNGKIESRILRGGSWDTFPHVCRCASRSFDNPSNSNNQIGFRVVCSLA